MHSCTTAQPKYRIPLKWLVHVFSNRFKDVWLMYGAFLVSQWMWGTYTHSKVCRQYRIRLKSVLWKSLSPLTVILLSSLSQSSSLFITPSLSLSLSLTHTLKTLHGFVAGLGCCQLQTIHWRYRDVFTAERERERTTQTQRTLLPWPLTSPWISFLLQAFSSSFLPQYREF